MLHKIFTCLHMVYIQVLNSSETSKWEMAEWNLRHTVQICLSNKKNLTNKHNDIQNKLINK